MPKKREPTMRITADSGSADGPAKAVDLHLLWMVS